jgi:hypothetical protein
VLVNKFSPANQSDMVSEALDTQEYKPSKISYKGATVSTVDKVVITSNEHENFIVKVKYIAVGISGLFQYNFVSNSDSSTPNTTSRSWRQVQQSTRTERGLWTHHQPRRYAF